MILKRVSNGYDGNPLIAYIKSPLGGGDMTDNNPMIEAKLGQAKRHILTDKKGIPLSTIITSANTHDIKAVTVAIDNAVLNYDLLLNLLITEKKQGEQ